MAFFAFVGTLFLSTASLRVAAAGEKYEFKDANTIIGSGGDYDSNQTFKKASGGKYETDQRCTGGRGVSSCVKLVISDITKNAGDRGYSAKVATATTTTGSTRTSDQANIQISDPEGVGPNGGASNPLRNTNGNTDEEPNCEDTSGPLGWLACSVVASLDGAITFLDGEIQERLIVSESKYEDTNIEKVWENIRNVAFLILVPIMLVMVIGTAVGFGPFDAYTVKKALPRMFAAVIFIALSLPVCQFFIQLANIAGTGILGLMTAPFTDSNQLTLASLYGEVGSLGIGAAAGAAAVGLFWYLAAGGIGIGIVISYAFVFMLILLLAYLILLIRELAIIFLLVIAPIAVLAWIFPGNDKPWKLWRGAFLNLLIMFPLIMGLIAAGRIMASLIDTSQGDFASFFLKLTAYIIPYLFIPATFKLAGGIFATVAGIANDRSRGLFDRNKKYRQNQYAQGNERIGRRVLQKRADMYSNLQKTASKGGIRGFAARKGARYIGGYNITQNMSARTASVGKEIGDIIATGDDSEIRGASVNLAAIKRMGDQEAINRGLLRIGDDGIRQYRSLGGKWVDEGAVIEGHKRWGNDTFAQQAILSYEMRKAQTAEEVEGISRGFNSLAREQWGMSANQAGGAWIGAAFENQNKHLEFKYTRFNEDGSPRVDAAGLATEIYENRGSYNMSQMNAHTVSQLKTAFDTGDQETKRKVQAIAESFMYRGGGAGPSQVATVEEGQPQFTPPRPMPPEVRVQEGQSGPTGIPTPAGRVAPETFYQTNTQGAPHVAENVRDLAVHVGVYRPDLASPRTTSDNPTPTVPPSGPPRPPTDIPRQN